MKNLDLTNSDKIDNHSLNEYHNVGGAVLKVGEKPSPTPPRGSPPSTATVVTPKTKLKPVLRVAPSAIAPLRPSTTTRQRPPSSPVIIISPSPVYTEPIVNPILNFPPLPPVNNAAPSGSMGGGGGATSGGESTPPAEQKIEEKSPTVAGASDVTESTPFYKSMLFLGLVGGTALAYIYLKTAGKNKNLNLYKTLGIGAGVGLVAGFGYDKFMNKPASVASTTPASSTVASTTSATTEQAPTSAEEVSNFKNGDVVNGDTYCNGAFGKGACNKK